MEQSGITKRGMRRRFCIVPQCIPRMQRE
uniref:Uncharacterized protein n=1 Tax=Arundo donax TaxID=35708 RepID=A0A0A9HM36_ARUDO